MDKLAELARISEIRGAMAAFVDAGLVKVASENQFDCLCDVVSGVIGDSDYDLNDVAGATDFVLSKVAEEEMLAHRYARRAMRRGFGKYAADDDPGMWDKIKGGAGRAWSGYKDALTFGQARRGHAAIGKLEKLKQQAGGGIEARAKKLDAAIGRAKKMRLIGAAKGLGAVAGTGALGAGLVYGGKKLYDRFRGGDE